MLKAKLTQLRKHWLKPYKRRAVLAVGLSFGALVLAGITMVGTSFASAPAMPTTNYSSVNGWDAVEPNCSGGFITNEQNWISPASFPSQNSYAVTSSTTAPLGLQINNLTTVCHSVASGVYFPNDSYAALSWPIDSQISTEQYLSSPSVSVGCVSFFATGPCDSGTGDTVASEGSPSSKYWQGGTIPFYYTPPTGSFSYFTSNQTITVTTQAQEVNTFILAGSAKIDGTTYPAGTTVYSCVGTTSTSAHAHQCYDLSMPHRRP